MSDLRDEEDIEGMLNKAFEARDKPKYFGMSYEEGVVAALDWALGNTDDSPLE
jgi:hypothetical protein